MLNVIKKMHKKMIVTSLVVQSERTFICADTGALMEESTRRFHPYKKYAFYSSLSYLNTIILILWSIFSHCCSI